MQVKWSTKREVFFPNSLLRMSWKLSFVHVFFFTWEISLLNILMGVLKWNFNSYMFARCSRMVGILSNLPFTEVIFCGTAELTIIAVCMLVALHIPQSVQTKLKLVVGLANEPASGHCMRKSVINTYLTGRLT